MSKQWDAHQPSEQYLCWAPCVHRMRQSRLGWRRIREHSGKR